MLEPTLDYYPLITQKRVCFFVVEINSCGMWSYVYTLNKRNERKVVNIFLPTCISLTYVLDAQRNRIIETVLWSTPNICFG